MDSQRVPVCLVTDDDEARMLTGTTAFLESILTPAGWSLKIILRNNNVDEQAEIPFRGLLPLNCATPRANCRVRLAAGDCDDVTFILPFAGRIFEAETSFGGLKGLIFWLDDEPNVLPAPKELEEDIVHNEEHYRIH